MTTSFVAGDHTYTIEVDAFLLDELRREFDVDFSSVESPDLVLFRTDECKAVKAMWVLSKDSRPPTQTYRHFAQIARGQVIDDGRAALDKALLDFFPPSRGQRHLAQRELFRTYRQLVDEGWDQEDAYNEARTQLSTAGDSPECSELSRGA